MYEGHTCTPHAHVHTNPSPRTCSHTHAHDCPPSPPYRVHHTNKTCTTSPVTSSCPPPPAQSPHPSCFSDVCVTHTCAHAYPTTTPFLHPHNRDTPSTLLPPPPASPPRGIETPNLPLFYFCLHAPLPYVNMLYTTCLCTQTPPLPHTHTASPLPCSSALLRPLLPSSLVPPPKGPPSYFCTPLWWHSRCQVMEDSEGTLHTCECGCQV
jgi:hypothetical protein